MTIGDFCSSVAEKAHKNAYIDVDADTTIKLRGDVCDAMQKLVDFTDVEHGLFTRPMYEASIRVAIGVGALAATGVIGAAYALKKAVQKMKSDY